MSLIGRSGMDAALHLFAIPGALDRLRAALASHRDAGPEPDDVCGCGAAYCPAPLITDEGEQ